LNELLELYQAKAAKVMDWEVPSLAVGAPADIAIFDLNTSRKVEPSRFLSKAKFSPWEGWELKGWPMATFVRGRKVYQRS